MTTPKNQFLPFGGADDPWAGLDTDVAHALRMPPLGPRKTMAVTQSILDLLTADEQAQLKQWAAKQTPDAGGIIDLMKWPGWAGRFGNCDKE